MELGTKNDASDIAEIRFEKSVKWLLKLARKARVNPSELLDLGGEGIVALAEAHLDAKANAANLAASIPDMRLQPEFAPRAPRDL